MLYINIYRLQSVKRSGWDKLSDFLTGHNIPDLERNFIYRYALSGEYEQKLCEVHANGKGLVVHIDGQVYHFFSKDGFTFEVEYVPDAPQ